MKQSSSPLTGTVNRGWRFGIVHASYYPEDVAKLVESAKEELVAAGIPTSNIHVYPVSGSFEIPLIGAALARSGMVDALIGLGIVVEGETHHARLIADAAARGMMEVQTQLGIPFAFEILYVDDLPLVLARLDRGAEAARAVLTSLALLSGIR